MAGSAGSHDLESFLAHKRAGARPHTTSTNPHKQLSQNAPSELQEKLFAIAHALGGVVVGPSAVSVPGARAFHLPEATRPARGAFMIHREFAHLHPPRDGSLHMCLASTIVDAVVANGWAERHPLAGQYGLPDNIVMVYGPRDEDELAIVADLLRASYANASAR
jgi:Family of unknown function (DUF5519)